MNTTRRSFLQTAAATGAMLGLHPAARGQAQTEPATRPAAGEAPKKLKLLILGGTGFLGPHTVRRAVERGHEMTLFNRGKTRPDLFPDLEKLRGDRDTDDLEALEGRQWDAVIDTSAYVPGHVELSASLLKEGLKQYVLLSSVSALGDHATPYYDESAPVAQVPDEVVEEVKTIHGLFAKYGRHYGGMKALCEKAAEKVLPGKVTNIRPGLISGPGDPSDRFSYWPIRIARGGEVLAPGDGSDPVQWIDVRDLAAWIIHCIEQNVTGLYHAVTPAGRFNMEQMLYGIKAAFWTDARFTWVPEEFLDTFEIRAWAEMPVWIPAHGDTAGFHLVKSEKAVANGLTFRPLAVTAKDTVEWNETRPEERQKNLRAGITAEREAEILEAWHERDTVKEGDTAEDETAAPDEDAPPDELNSQ
ncbi:MAG: NAD-dependent epimerase/dehydratase family protein [Planctomycetota bacterium]|nr:NAD-dependent epimerase/dehydratase family protein [Planctomycetota bacterium]